MTSTNTSTLRRALCLLAVCALTAPTAALADRDLRSPDARDAAQGRHLAAPPARQDLRSPDARDAAQGRNLAAPPTRQDLRSPDTRAVARGASQTLPATSKPAGSASGGLDWPSAGLGAVMLGGLLLAGYAASGVMRHIRTRATARLTADSRRAAGR